MERCPSVACCSVEYLAWCCSHSQTVSWWQNTIVFEDERRPCVAVIHAEPDRRDVVLAIVAVVDGVGCDVPVGVAFAVSRSRGPE
jgi:hypothetical protein